MHKLIPSCEDQILMLYTHYTRLARATHSHTGKTVLIGFLCNDGSWVRFARQPSIVLDDAGYQKLYALERANNVVTTFAVHY